MKGSKITQLLREGKTISEIVAEVGCAESSVAYYRNKLGMSKRQPKYDWLAIAERQSEGASFEDCRKEFGISRTAWTKAIQRGVLKPYYDKDKWFGYLDQEAILSKAQRRRFAGSLRRYILRHGLIKYECAECGNIGIWRDKAVALQLDHINGDSGDNRLHNLRFLCPNCHAQTETYGGKNTWFYKKRIGLVHADPATVE
jgi:5-methylcytosine-specific restriction endonuclease McrA